MNLTITTKYMGLLRTEATHLASGNTLITDAPTDNNGRGQAFSPTDLVAAALGSCMLTIMGITANRHKLNVEGTQIEIVKIMIANPRQIAEIILTFTMPNNDFTEMDRTSLENAARTCPVALSLNPDLKQTVIFNW
ncbi:OsmC family protein [Adhaeribacter radiodurans]|uniref:OsmC family protein n=1 Tax=Adhaeribacter radiodurans TaxID=2745197 RepID=A0A7L7LBJ6_9BACT|nr:OsmC family protein [Adhaeribacter radiodurans]QMU30200.1 OsmC family protein [Adhaeribacter radiodurans]